MDIFVYSDESGVFDKVHNDYFVFGGLIFLNREQKDVQVRKYIKAEKTIRAIGKYKCNDELKASFVTNKEKGKLYRSLNQCIKFAAVVRQQKVNDNIYDHKKTKQRYMDYVFKIALKKALEKLIEENKINVNEVKDIYIHCDEHTTATDGRYELREGLEQEFKIGTINYKYMKFYPPVFKTMNNIKLKFCDSRTVHLIRAADVVANRIYYKVVNGYINRENVEELRNKNLYITFFP